MKKIFILLFLVFTFNFNAAFAHKINSAMSIIDIHDDGENVEITHKLYAHDLEHALDLGSVGLDYFQTKKGQALVRDYILSRFILRDKSMNNKYKFIGCEIAGDILFVYFEGKLAKGQNWELDSNILQDVADGQTNYVNINFKNKTQTLIFDNGQGIANIEIK